MSGGMGSRSFGRWAVAVLLLLAAPAADTRDTRADAEPAPSLPRWLVGHWVLERDGKRIEENWTDGLDRLHAEVSAEVEGKEHAQRFDYRRVSCPLQRRR